MSKKTYSDDDFISVLDENPVITKTVQTRLAKKYKLYKNIHYDTVRKTLIRLLGAEKISGGLNEELNVYTWKKKEE